MSCSIDYIINIALNFEFGNESGGTQKLEYLF